MTAGEEPRILVRSTGAAPFQLHLQPQASLAGDSEAAGHRRRDFHF